MSILDDSSAAFSSEEAALLAFMEGYEPVIDTRLYPCSGGCGRQVSPEVRICVRCRNTSQHPALWARRQA